MKIINTIFKSILLALLISCSEDDQPNILNLVDQTLNISELAVNNDTVGVIVMSDGKSYSGEYTIITGNTDNVFKVSSTGELVINDASSLDYEEMKEYRLEVEAVVNNNSSQATILINVDDKDETNFMRLDGRLFHLNSTGLLRELGIINPVEDLTSVSEDGTHLKYRLTMADAELEKDEFYMFVDADLYLFVELFNADLTLSGAYKYVDGTSIQPEAIDKENFFVQIALVVDDNGNKIIEPETDIVYAATSGSVNVTEGNAKTLLFDFDITVSQIDYSEEDEFVFNSPVIPGTVAKLRFQYKGEFVPEDDEDDPVDGD